VSDVAPWPYIYIYLWGAPLQSSLISFIDSSLTNAGVKSTDCYNIGNVKSSSCNAGKKFVHTITIYARQAQIGGGGWVRNTHTPWNLRSSKIENESN
jgi:hypothetical protein